MPCGAARGLCSACVKAPRLFLGAGCGGVGFARGGQTPLTPVQTHGLQRAGSARYLAAISSRVLKC